jgi:hypothetical protein
MQLPLERGPVSRHVIDALTHRREDISDVAVAGHDIIRDPDTQLALWILYELHYRGFDDVPDDLEWHPALLSLRRTLERRFEDELRETVQPRLQVVDAHSDVATGIETLIAHDEADSAAAYLHRHATREQFVDFLRERSVQQLKESDPQSFVLPRLRGAAKVALAELQYDEYGAGRPERLHQTLYAEAMEAAGLDATYGRYVDDVSGISLANANVMSLFGLNRRWRGAAMGHFAAFEATSSTPSRRISIGAERLDFPLTVAAYFDEHVEADAVHEQVALRDICCTLVAEEPSLRDDVLFGAGACLHLAAVSAEELLTRWSPTFEEEEAS